MAETLLQAARRKVGYKAAEVIALLIQQGRAQGVDVMPEASLKSKLSRWENGHEPVTVAYRPLFRAIYGRTNEELGFPADEEDHEVVELRSRLAIARSVDAGTVAAFQSQVNNTRQVDRRFGGVTLLDQLRGTINQVEGMLTYSTIAGQRENLAAVLTEASTLAGWQALDRNAIGQAWDHYERAKMAARESGSVALLAHATAEQAFVLIDIGETAQAVQQLGEARALVGQSAPTLLRAWLAAAHGEGLAAVGHRDEALRAFDAAEGLLPVEPVDPALPFLVLGDSHLDRWRGNALAKVGDPDAIEQLTDALVRLPEEFTRAQVGMLVDLAFAHAASGDRDAARKHQREARRLGVQIKSDRQLRRLDGLVLPG